MFELIGITIVCATVLAGLMLVLHYFKAYRIERQEWLESITKNVMGMVDERLAQQANYKKDLEKLAQELELIKKTQQISTRLTRPPGSLV